MLDAAQRVEGVRGAALALILPPSSANWIGGELEISGQPSTAAEKHPVFGVNVVTPEFFATVGLRPRAGRVFAAAPDDTNRLRPKDMLVSETFARQHWPQGSALGARFRAVAGGPWMTVVGIVGDVRMPGRWDRVGHAQIYQPMPYGFSSPRLVVRSDEPLASLSRRLLAAIAAADPAIRVRRITTAESTLEDATAVPRFLTVLVGAFAALALILATVGLYSVIAISMSQRVRELGIRLALGAQGRDIIALVLGDGLRLAGIGLALGIVASFGATRALRSQLFGVGTSDAGSLAVVVALVTATALLAAYLPARRAARGDPIVALRSE